MFVMKLLISASGLVFPFAVCSNLAIFNSLIGSRKTNQIATNSKKGNQVDHMKLVSCQILSKNISVNVVELGSICQPLILLISMLKYGYCRQGYIKNTRQELKWVILSISTSMFQHFGSLKCVDPYSIIVNFESKCGATTAEAAKHVGYQSNESLRVFLLWTKISQITLFCGIPIWFDFYSDPVFRAKRLIVVCGIILFQYLI